MSLPKLGIVIPAYNAERYIVDCLRSALNQQYPGVHVYVVDDASSDDTCKRIAEVASVHPHRISWRSRRQNRGEGFTRQEATEMALADGCKYIAPLDADDLRKPDSLERQVALLESAPDAGICYGATDFISSKGKPLSGTRWERYNLRLKRHFEGEVWDHLVAFGRLGTMDTVVIRDEAARRCRYAVDFPCLADLDYMAQIATLPECSRFVASDEVVASYRLHHNQSPNDHDREAFPRLVYTITQDVALRVFDRLEKQGRPVSRSKRRRLWRLLVARTYLKFMRRWQWSDVLALGRDLLTPITRLEAPYRELITLSTLDSRRAVKDY